MDHDEPHPGGVDQQLQLPLASGQVNDEPGDKNDEQGEAAHLQCSRNEQQNRPNELQAGHERQVAKTMFMERVEERVVPHDEQTEAQHRMKEHEGTTYLLGSHV